MTGGFLKRNYSDQKFKILKKELSPKNSIPGKVVLQEQRRDKENIEIKFIDMVLGNDLWM